MEAIWSALSQAVNQLGTIRVADFVDILLVTVGTYALIGLIRKTQSKRIFMGIFYILILLWISEEFQLHTVNYILRNAVQIGLLALVVLFQPEIRRFLEKFGNGTKIFRAFSEQRSQVTDSAIAQTLLACKDMSDSRTGALIIFERDNKLDEQIRTGTIVDGAITAELLKNIFFVKAPMHDGAVIIRNGRVYAAGCVLPLTNSTNVSKDLGMRHRAGIGMSEASDAVVLIVSEETGAISVVIDGQMKRHLSVEAVDKLLHANLMPKTSEETVGKFRFLRRKEKDNINE